MNRVGPDGLSAAAKFDICIVGAGLSGSALARELAGRDLKVAVLEAGTCAGQGASAYSGGIMRVFDEDPVQADLARRGVAEWLALSLPARVITTCGVLNIVGDGRGEEVEQIVNDLASPSYPIEVLTSDRAARLFPSLRSGLDRTLAVYERLGGTIDVKLAARLMLNSARENGCVVLEHASLKSASQDENGMILECDGFTIRCALLVIAAGPWSQRFLKSSTLSPRRIQMSVRNAPAIQCCIVDQTRGGYIVPKAEKTVLVGSFDPPSLAAPSADMAPCPDRKAQHNALLNDFGCEIQGELGEIVGMDAYTENLLPLVGFTEKSEAIYSFTGFSGRGAKYLPYCAKVAANELAEAAACAKQH